MNRRPGKIELVAALVSTALALWLMVPEHDRQLLTMRALESGRRLAARGARGQGQAGMGDELDGSPGTAAQYYGAAAALGRLRDELAGRLEAMRP